MFHAVNSPYRVSYKGKFDVRSAPTKPEKKTGSQDRLREQLQQSVAELDEQQRLLYASNKYALLLIFQAMDAAGKDSTIRAVMRGINPTGCQVYAFKKPSDEELDHDFLWRCARCLPERGRIGVFNRSYYEEVLAVRVHPEYLDAQRLPNPVKPGRLWSERYESIRNFELHLARNGTVVLKFWLHVSKGEQRARFLSRLREPQKHWKFAVADVQERGHWSAYMKAYAEALTETSRPWAPWYAIPADNKAYLQLQVADVIVRSLQSLQLAYPEVQPAERLRFREMERLLTGES